MADKSPQGPVEMGAEMDYSEHERAYNLFLTITKHASLHIAAVLIALAFGFFTSAGFFSALVLFILMTAIGTWLLL